MAATASPQPKASLEQKRQLIYAALIRYAPETVPLRHRALDRLVLGALMGSNSSEPYRLGAIQSNLLAAPSAPLLRNEVIQDALARLASEGLVEHTLVKERHAYFPTPRGHDELTKMIGNAEDLFRPVLEKLTANTTALVQYDIATAIFRQFLSECFARFGAEIARSVTGHLKPDELMIAANASAAFEAAIGEHQLSESARESLEIRCGEFLSSSDPADVALKFHLTQGFYFAQLLGLQDSPFNPLTEDVFAGSKFYLDTNVLLVGLLEPEHGSELFREMVLVARRLGIELCVTRATINETRRVAADRLQQITAVLNLLPDEITAKAEDDFLTAFLSAREKDPSLSPESFLSCFDYLTDTIKDKW